MTEADGHSKKAEPRNRWLRAIAVFKFCKAVLLAATALATLNLLRPSVAGAVQDWAQRIPLGDDQGLVQRVLGWVSGLGPQRIAALGAGALAYATLFTVEGVGLWRERRWAEWLTVVATSSLVPLEIWEVERHPIVSRVLLLLINLAIVAYLVRGLVKRER